MNETLTRTVLLPLHERLRGRRTLSYYRRLRAHETWDAVELTSERERKLRALLAHCRSQVPYWRDHLTTAGINEGDVLTLDDLQRCPVTERADIRDSLDSYCASNWVNRRIRYATGGSTGEPLVFYTDRIKETRHNAHKLRYRGWFGVRPGDRQVDFWGSPIEWSKQSALRSWKDRWLLNQELLSAFDLTNIRLDTYIEKLRRFQPRIVYGYPTVIHRVATRIIERGIETDAWQPRLVACTAEMLLEHQRESIVKAFGCPVANEYGSRDAGAIAHECPHGRLHIAAEHVIVEVDAPDPKGIGDLLITNLDGRAMPLIRYRVGDQGWLDSTACSCGLSFPVVGGVKGRTNDFLVGRDGKLVHSLAPIYILRENSKLSQFRIRQRPNHSLEVQLVTRDELTSRELDEIRTQLRATLDLDVEIDFRFSTTIEPEPSGKYRWVVSEVRGAR